MLTLNWNWLRLKKWKKNRVHAHLIGERADAANTISVFLLFIERSLKLFSMFLFNYNIFNLYIYYIRAFLSMCAFGVCVCVCARAEKCIFRCKRFPQWREMCNERQCVCWHCNMSSHFLLYGCFWLKWMLAQCTYAMLLLLLQKSVMIVRRTRAHKQHFQFI